MSDEPQSKILFSRDIAFNEKNGNLLKVVVTDFRGNEYLSIREYFQDFDGEWYPAREGITHILSLELALGLNKAFSDLLTA